MYAIIRSGGKQYRVREGDRIAVERLDAAEGDTVTIGDVLLLETDGNTQVGTPVVDGASVTARVERQMRDRKVTIFKYKNKTRKRTTRGHRQHLTELTITGIAGA